MSKKTDRYKVTTWHGKGNTLWYVMDMVRDEVVLTYQSVEGDRLEHAKVLVEVLNRG